jgi:MFS transporter, AAHS family, 3-hydroxyphenylpropionic acid transporter
MSRAHRESAISGGGFPARATLVVCAAAALLEGFDNQSMGVAAPMLFREFSIAPSEGGVIFSAATLGLFLGAAVGGRVADYVGRSKTLALSLLLFGVCSLLNAASRSINVIVMMRLFTGLGLGGAMPNFIALATEAVGARRRLGALTMVMAALPCGGALAGSMALAERIGWTWRAIFLVGGLAPIVLALVAIRLPREPASGDPDARDGRAGRRTLHVDGVATVLWAMGRARTTALLWGGFFFTNLILFLMLNWLPSLIIGLGFSRTEASAASIVFNLAGALGAVSLGRMHAGAHRRRWVLVTYAGIAAALLTLAAAASAGRTFVVAIFACSTAGVFIVGAQLILYALAPLYYPRRNRATGVGAAVAVGRLGSVAGPLFAGTVLASGGASASVLSAIIPFVVIAGAAALALTSRPESLD